MALIMLLTFGDLADIIAPSDVAGPGTDPARPATVRNRGLGPQAGSGGPGPGGGPQPRPGGAGVRRRRGDGEAMAGRAARPGKAGGSAAGGDDLAGARPARRGDV